MKRITYFALSLSLLLSFTPNCWLAVSLASSGASSGASVGASDEETGAAERLKTSLLAPSAKALMTPLGTATSAGTFRLNGSLSSYQAPFWRDAVLEASQGFSVRAALPNIGELTLYRGAKVRLSVEEVSHTLSVTLLTGEMNLALAANAAAHLHAEDGSFAAAPGSRLRYGWREAQSFAEVSQGHVEKLASAALARPSVQPLAFASWPMLPMLVNTQDGRKLSFIGGYNASAVFDVKQRGRREIQVQVTDENGRKLEGVPLVFFLGSNVGQVAATTVITGPNGIATFNFTAANLVSSSSFTVQIQGTNIMLPGKIAVTKAGFLASTQTISLIAGGVGAGIFGTYLAVRDPEPTRITASGTPAIRP